MKTGACRSHDEIAGETRLEHGGQKSGPIRYFLAEKLYASQGREYF